MSKVIFVVFGEDFFLGGEPGQIKLWEIRNNQYIDIRIVNTMRPDQQSPRRIICCLDIYPCSLLAYQISTSNTREDRQIRVVIECLGYR